MRLFIRRVFLNEGLHVAQRTTNQPIALSLSISLLGSSRYRIPSPTPYLPHPAACRDQTNVITARRFTTHSHVTCAALPRSQLPPQSSTAAFASATTSAASAASPLLPPCSRSSHRASACQHLPGLRRGCLRVQPAPLICCVNRRHARAAAAARASYVGPYRHLPLAAAAVD